MSEFLDDTIKAVMFDFDDTLVGTHEPIWKLHRHIAKTFYGVELDDELLRKHWGQPINVLARHYYQTTDTDAAIRLIKEQTLNFPKETFIQTEPTLRKLKLAGKILGIVSASHLSILTKDMEIAGIPPDLIDYIQTSEDTDTHKPDPAVFNPMITWSTKHNIQPHEILYIGDGIQDMIASTNAGLNFLGVTTGLVDNEEFSSHGAVSIADLSEL